MHTSRIKVTRENVLVQFESKYRWNPSKLKREWYQVLVPELKLCMTTRHKARTCNQEDDNQLNSKLSAFMTESVSLRWL